MVDVRRSTAGDPRVRSFLDDHGHSVVARGGELVDATSCPALVVDEDGELVGVLTYQVTGLVCEILTLHAVRQWSGIGTALVREIEWLAADLGCRTLILTTTNDNVDALRFYQRRGFRLAELRSRAVDEARRILKPSIPAVGDHGIPLRDELELVRELTRRPL